MEEIWRPASVTGPWDLAPLAREASRCLSVIRVEVAISRQPSAKTKSCKLAAHCLPEQIINGGVAAGVGEKTVSYGFCGRNKISEFVNGSGMVERGSWIVGTAVGGDLTFAVVYKKRWGVESADCGRIADFRRWDGE
jgi:hypothetical protein